MKKKEYLKKIIAIFAVIMLIYIICMPKTYAVMQRPSDIKGNDETIEDFGFEENLINALTTIGTFIAVGVLMVIGIKYMAGSLEEKATYKKSMVPYVIGCVLLFGASAIAPKMIEIFKEAEEAEEIGNTILGVIQVIGSFVSVGVLMLLGIKYMVGSTEERASYKRSMLPYLIGAVLLFGAVNITAAIVEMSQETADSIAPYSCTGCGKGLSSSQLGSGKCPYCGYMFKRY